MQEKTRQLLQLRILRTKYGQRRMLEAARAHLKIVMLLFFARENVITNDGELQVVCFSELRWLRTCGHCLLIKRRLPDLEGLVIESLLTR